MKRTKRLTEDEEACLAGLQDQLATRLSFRERYRPRWAGRAKGMVLDVIGLPIRLFAAPAQKPPFTCTAKCVKCERTSGVAITDFKSFGRAMRDIVGSGCDLMKD